MTAVTPGGLGAPAPEKPRKAVLGSREADDEAVFAALDTRIIRRFSRFLAPYRWTLIGAVASILIFVAANVAVPSAIGFVIQETIARQAHDASRIPFGWVISGFAALIVVNLVFSFLQDWLSARLAQRVIFDLRRSMFAHLQDISLSVLDQTHVGRIMSRLQGDVNALQEFLESSMGALADMATLIAVIFVLLEMNLKLGFLTLTVLPALIGLRALWLPRVKDTFRRARDASSIVNGALAENINGIRTVQESRREAVNYGLFEDKVRENFEAQVDAARAARIMTPTVSILTGVAMAMVMVVGGGDVLRHTLSIGGMVAYILYVRKFFEPVGTLSQQYTGMQRAMAAGYRIFEVLDVPVTIKDKPDAIELRDIETSIELDHVTFGYRSGQPVLHDVSLSVKPRELVALVGPTGSGKTSITALVNRFYDVWEGQVRVGGHDVRDVSLASLGRTVAMVLQEPFLFTGTVMENILYSNPGATREQAVAAARAVNAHEFILKMPDGYDSQLGQRGRNLSIGQRQLISFARALVADPQILILDEATANIDSFTELAIQRALKVLFEGRTSLVIAHRLATIRDADRIVVLQQGHIVEQGTHDELVAKKGLYAHLYSSNYASFDDIDVKEEDPAFAMHT
ncbi:MAG TPA: ABC transporter ATP-binding protein [Caulobacteraceae bacterium]|jgi:ATP-binding cassette subfamily B protein|nr:ABC transporter ATP-binding protein [Caulobacteraceae bacterium]